VVEPTFEFPISCKKLFDKNFTSSLKENMFSRFVSFLCFPLETHVTPLRGKSSFSG